MSNSWFRIDSSLINDFKIATLKDKEFMDKFYACMKGEKNEFSSFIKGPYTRPLVNEWRLIRAKIFKRDNYTCRYCGERAGKLECDHIIPISRGGNNNETNLVTACFVCNRSKRSKLLSEWKGGIYALV